ncbi:uncharacterized protein LOC122319470 [Drosophila yakuba]|uniref:uncharacterized protein LOC122319470 n=1 Tax=Drosophila yakuba TaxID=7245 RepID=UPI001C8A6B3D|nr:uncharacterized protein LOC122319470 [Drosophila yakuba]
MERPFLVCGVDFCGPFYVSLKIRGRPPIKTYVAVFVCFSSKAVHLELVVDLSTDSFLSVFKRFVGRRGLPEKVYSDNATNFVGACNVLKELSEAFHRSRDELSGYAAQSGVEWCFIPPRSPHFGGLWEAAVKSAKTRLLRGVGNAKLTADELSTHLVEVDALLNSRPIASPGNDPNDGEALTPGHLLMGQPLITLPQESGTGGVCSKASCAYLKRWRMLSALKQQFWDSWSKDYIASLQQRNKWSVGCRDLEVGCLVVVHEDNVPPQRWLTGRVVATTAGEDGRVRVAEIRTSGGVIKRAIHKLALLPVDTAPVEKMKEPEAFNGAGMSEQ